MTTFDTHPTRTTNVTLWYATGAEVIPTGTYDAMVPELETRLIREEATYGMRPLGRLQSEYDGPNWEWLTGRRQRHRNERNEKETACAETEIRSGSTRSTLRNS